MRNRAHPTSFFLLNLTLRLACVFVAALQAPVILRRTFKHTAFSTPMLQDNSPEEVAAVDAAGPAAAGESLEHGAGCDKVSRRLVSLHGQSGPCLLSAIACTAVQHDYTDGLM